MVRSWQQPHFYVVFWFYEIWNTTRAVGLGTKKQSKLDKSAWLLLSRTRYYWKWVWDKNFIFFISPLLHLRLSLVYCLVHPAYKKHNSFLLDECVCWSNGLKNRKKGGKNPTSQIKNEFWYSSSLNRLDLCSVVNALSMCNQFLRQ